MRIWHALQEYTALPRPFLLGIIATLPLSLLSSFPLFMPPPFSQAIVFRSITAVLIFCILSYLLWTGNWRLVTIPKLLRAPLFALLAYIIILLLALLNSMDPHFSFWGNPYRGWGMLTYLFYPSFAILLFLFLREKGWKLVWTIVFLVGGIAALIAVSQQLSLFSNTLVESSARPFSTFGNTIFFAIFIASLIPLLLVRILQTNRWYRVAWILLLIFLLYAILITETRGVYIALAGSIFFFLFFYSRKLGFLKKAGFAVFLFALLAFLSINILPRPSLADQNVLAKNLWQRLSLRQAIPTEPRLATWPYALQGIQEKPLFGYGPYNSSIPFNKHYDSSSLRLQGRTTGWWDTFHNYYLDIAIGAGLLGLTAFLAFLILLWQKLQSQKKRLASHSLWLRVHGVQASLLVYLISMLFAFNSFATYLLFYLLVGYSFFLISKTKKIA
jgi:O-antigen ligase